MKILHVSNYYPERNTGASGTIMALGEAMDSAGNTVTFSWRDAPLSRWGHNFSRIFEIPSRQMRQARAALEKAEYDAVIVHQPHGWRIFAELAPAHPRTVFLNFSHGWEMCVPSFAPEAPSPFRRFKDAVASHYIRQHCERAAKLSDGVVAINRLDAEYLVREYGLSPDKVCVLTLGLDPWLVNGPARIAPPQDQPVRFIFIGNYVAQKGWMMLEAALTELAKEDSRFIFTCITHEDKHAAIRKRLGPILGQRLKLLGWSAREALAEQMRHHDFLLFSSAYEGFGKVAHEAMACGLAVVGTRCGVLADRATHGVNALLSTPGDLPGFLTNLRQAAAHPELANSLGARARADAQGDTWAATARQFYSFIDAVRVKKLAGGK